MPRRSAAELSVIAVQGKPERLHAPASMSEAERRLFAELVGGCDPRHFRQSDMPLLVRYVEAACLADQAAADIRANGAVVDGRANPWLQVQERAIKAMVSLSMRLRLSPQSRIATRSMVGRSQARPVSYYDTMDLLDGEDDRN